MAVGSSEAVEEVVAPLVEMEGRAAAQEGAAEKREGARSQIQIHPILNHTRTHPIPRQTRQMPILIPPRQIQTLSSRPHRWGTQGVGGEEEG